MQLYALHLFRMGSKSGPIWMENKKIKMSVAKCATEYRVYSLFIYNICIYSYMYIQFKGIHLHFLDFPEHVLEQHTRFSEANETTVPAMITPDRRPEY